MPQSPRIIDLIKLVTESKDYEEKFVKVQLEVIAAERIGKEERRLEAEKEERRLGAEKEEKRLEVEKEERRLRLEAEKEER